ncbi:MAG: hypothetical protein IIA67_06555 [Planctomycetes bacterium]|nr:hypothetical protein [Planctomycetota bacterium]
MGDPSAPTIRQERGSRCRADRIEATISDERPTIGRIARIGGLELLETEAEAASPVRGRLRGSLLYLRYKAFDPDGLLDRLLPYARPFFTRAFVVVSAALILTAFAVTLSEAGRIGQELRALLGVHSLALAWLTVLVVTAETTKGARNSVEVRVVAIAKDLGFMSNWSSFASKRTIRKLYQLDDDYPLKGVCDEIERFCRQSDIEVLSLLPTYLNEDAPSLCVSPFDQHPNAYGHALAADAIYEYIEPMIQVRGDE